MSVTQINWDEYLKAQSDLDLSILKSKGLAYSSTSANRVLALIVELAELSNETKSFKFWSEASWNRERALEEYVDTFHFLLSIFLQESYTPNELVYQNPASIASKSLITELFLFLFSSVQESVKSSIKWREWTSKFLELGSSLGFHWTEISEAYWSKRKINIQRQQSGY